MAKETRKSSSKLAGASTQGIVVVAKRAEFYRAGRRFGHEPVQIALSELTEEQLEVLKDEPMLVVRDVDIESSDAADPSAPATPGA